MSVIERVLRRDVPGSTIEPMRRRDLRHGVMVIEQASHPRPWSRNVFESEIEGMRKGTRHYVVLREGRAIAGYAGLWFTPDEAHVTNVAVDPDRRRSGVATRLLLALAAEARNRGMAAWTLEVRVSGTGAQELYRRFGFVPAGVRTRYYENREDALVMWCHGLLSDEYARRLRAIEEALAAPPRRATSAAPDGGIGG
jgi:ribosomal-protein-alanine N-acetyltransferase